MSITSKCFSRIEKLIGLKIVYEIQINNVKLCFKSFSF